MKKLLAIIRKDAILRFSSRSELVFFIILPVIFTFLLAGGAPSGDGEYRIPLVVVDQADTPFSRAIVSELESSTVVQPEAIQLAEAERRFEERRVEILLILPPGLDLESIRAGEAQVEIRGQPNNLNASLAERAVRTAVRRVGSAVDAASLALKTADAQHTFESEAGRQAYFLQALELAQQLQAEEPERVTVRLAAAEDEVDYDPRANTSAGQLITWVFIPLFGISGLFAYERQQGTLSRMLTTPTGRGTYLFGTIAGQVLMALVQMGLLVAFGIFVMGLAWGRDPLALAVILTASALAAGAIGTAMGTFIKSEGQANGLSIMMGMLMALMGGCWYPLELFPAAVQSVVRILPTTWAMQGMLDLVLRAGGLRQVLPEAAVLLGFAALFFAVGVWRFRYE